jgi:multidrug efflux pump subunit AcrA (membrane-fusion protein)
MTADKIYLRKDPVIRICTFVCFGLFGGFLLWASLVKLDEGVAAGGTIIVENNRRVIQHLEGGLVDAISVREGDTVSEGDTLLVLTNTAGVAAQAEVVTQIASLSATVLRLEAQRERRATVDFVELDGFSLTKAAKDNIIEREIELFEQETATLAAEVAVLRQRAQGALRALIPIRAQKDASLKALAALEDQLERKAELVALQLARLDEF